MEKIVKDCLESKKVGDSIRTVICRVFDFRFFEFSSFDALFSVASSTSGVVDVSLEEESDFCILKAFERATIFSCRAEKTLFLRIEKISSKTASAWAISLSEALFKYDSNSIFQ